MRFRVTFLRVEGFWVWCFSLNLQSSPTERTNPSTQARPPVSEPSLNTDCRKSALMSFLSASTSTRSNLSTIMLDTSFPTSNKKSGLQRVPSDRGAQSIPLFGIDSKGIINLWNEKTEELTG